MSRNLERTGAHSIRFVGEDMVAVCKLSYPGNS
jgi:hypothetical protein